MLKRRYCWLKDLIKLLPKKLILRLLVRKRTIPTELRPLVDQFSVPASADRGLPIS
jgi:hypothetical protein